MTRMELVIKDSQMYRPLVLLALIILGINKREFLMVLVLAAMEPVVLGRTAMEPVVLVLAAMEPLAGGYDGGPGGSGAGGFPGGMGGGPPGYPGGGGFPGGHFPGWSFSWRRCSWWWAEVHLAVPQMVMEEGFLAVFMEEAVNFLDG